MITKICTKCKIDKPLDGYYVHPRAKHGRRPEQAIEYLKVHSGTY